MTSQTPQWSKSTYSEPGANCVEVARNLIASSGVVPVRDSKNPSGPVLAVPVAAFSAFIKSVKSRQIDA
ncbi:DUF397 domain-containing protein [Streptomyces sp. NPDC090025]|uniref:DUF397 domain-containing protein n=1 Tax=Streptomyces sp. NPDC090025 TaxID=3365922 RepID=UPI003832D3D0